MSNEWSSKKRVLGLLNGEKVDRVPCFSGMGNITVPGLEKYGAAFQEVHKNAEQMANAASSSYDLYGYETAVVPFDLGVEAEAFGCNINYYEHTEGILYPTVKTKVLKTGDKVSVPDDFLERGRIPVVADALRLLQKNWGDKIAIGTYILGPYTMAGQLMDLNDLLKNSFKQKEAVTEILEGLIPPLIALAKHYKDAGGDYITVREMGAPSDIISPKMFNSLIVPPLKKLIEGLPGPRILHMCGDTNPIIEMMQACGAEALSVEQRNDISASREKLGKDAVILGNIDAYNVLVQSKPDVIKENVQKAIEAGVDGIMPGCDIWPEISKENMLALVNATKEFGKV
jgi:[methyl-Co(III) methanol-specific corrinoid protein]:coenzyme M methyltransferase